MDNPHGELLEAIGNLIDAVKDARSGARLMGELNVLREIDRCSEAAISARKWTIKALSQGQS